MGIISRRFKWLEVLFPPAEAQPINPSTVSNDIALTHELLPGTERLDEVNYEFVNGAAGVLVINSSSPPAGKFYYCIACSLEHDDGATARVLMILIQRPTGSNWAGLMHEGLASAERPFPVGRPFILPPRHTVRWETTAILGTKRIQGHLLFLELNIGEPIPPM